MTAATRPLVVGKTTASAQPFWLGSGSEACAAFWLDGARPVSRRVAILCPSIGPEHLRGQPDFRELARRLAEQGVSTLRFDYPATGNSTGEAVGEGDGPDLMPRWRSAIVDAVAHARSVTPECEVVLIGRRLGALLALEASREFPGGVAACVLWDPPSSGRTLLREIRMREAARFDWRYAEELEREQPGVALQWDGHRFSAATVAGIGRLALAATWPDAARVEIVAPEPDRLAGSLAAWPALSSAIVSMHPAGNAAFDWTQYEGDLSERSLELVASAITRGAGRLGEVQPFTYGVAPIRSRVREEHGIRHEMVHVGEDGGMFGVATEPVGSVQRAVLILPTGIESSSGHGDMWTRFARSAAMRGTATLRIDWRGNGESVAAESGARPTSYSDAHLDDAREACAWARARWPDRPVTVIGLCSGGYFAVHAAAAGIDADAIVAINPQLYWREGMPMQLGLEDLAPAVDMQLALGAERALADATKWRRLVRGGYALRDVIRAVRGVLTRRAIAVPVRAGTAELLGGQLPRLDMVRLFPGRIATHLVYSDDDFGLPHLEAHGRAFKRAMAQPGMRLHRLEACDHTFSRERMRQRLDELLLSILDAT